MLVADDESTIDVQRISLTGNHDGDGGDDSSQAVLSTFGSAKLRLSDSVVGAGIDAEVATAEDSSIMHLVNLTVASHTGVGLSVTASTPAAVVIANTISFANAGSNALVTGNAVTQQSNLHGTDPMFADFAGGDYRLTASSPAVDSGTATPSGGVSSRDRTHGPRRAGPLPDRGAYERDGLFADGFETGDRFWWHASAP